MLIPMQKGPVLDQRIVFDDLTNHLLTLRAEFAQTVEDMAAINANSAAAAHYSAQRTCERFLTRNEAPEIRT